jgi:hypothetical protein
VIDRFVVVVLHVRPVVASSSSRSSSVVAIDVVASFVASFARARARRSPARVVRPRGAPAVARTSFSARPRRRVPTRPLERSSRGARAIVAAHRAARRAPATSSARVRSSAFRVTVSRGFVARTRSTATPRADSSRAPARAR